MSYHRTIERQSFIPELPYEGLVRKVCGPQWRTLTGRELDGAWGVAIVRSILDGCRPDLTEIAAHLGVEREALQAAYRSLSQNGVFCRNRIESDRTLRKDDLLAWSYYAGYASGATGNWVDRT
jgi:hypothetical protein